MTKLIINADDFGYCESVNEGIIFAHKNGIVTSTTIMAGMPGFEHGIDLLKNTPSLKVGVHMTLTCGEPILKSHKTIVNDKGIFYRYLENDDIEKMDKEEIYNEFCAQIDKVIENNIEITHIDSHHHIHGLKSLEDVVKRIVKKYNLPIRGMFTYDIKNLSTNIIPHPVSFYKEDISVNFFEKNKDEIYKYELIDIMCHPAYISDYLSKSTSYSLERQKELEILTSRTIKDDIEKLGMKLTNYKDM